MKIRVFIATMVLLLLSCGCGEQAPVAEQSAAGQKSISVGAEESSQTVEPSVQEERSEVESTISTATDGETSEEIAEPEDPMLTIVMVGDVLLHTPVAESGKKEDGGYSFDHLFTHTGELTEAADLAMVNQEVILGGTELKISGYPAFNAPYELGDALVEAGFNTVLHATNHAMDKGKKGLTNCLNFWETVHPKINVLGIHGSAEDADEIFVFEKDGIRVAVVNYTYGTNGIPLPEDMPYAVDLLEEEKLIRDLDRAEELADFTICCPHWGTEYVLEQTKHQRRWAKLMAEHGADLIIGTHPHVIEPVCGLVREEDGTWTEKSAQEVDFTQPGAVLCYYSLGNFVNWTSGTGKGVANRMVGCMADVTLQQDREGKVVIRSFQAIPLVSHLEKGFGGVTVYPLPQYSEELAERNEIRKQDSDFTYEYCVNLAEKVLQWNRSEAQEQQKQ
ncbi:MAG: CapA family protein [Acetatifactor sp.]